MRLQHKTSQFLQHKTSAPVLLPPMQGPTTRAPRPRASQTGTGPLCTSPPVQARKHAKESWCTPTWDTALFRVQPHVGYGLVYRTQVTPIHYKHRTAFETFEDVYSSRVLPRFVCLHSAGNNESITDSHSCAKVVGIPISHQGWRGLHEGWIRLGLGLRLEEVFVFDSKSDNRVRARVRVRRSLRV